MVNAQTERVFGTPAIELLGQPVEMLVPPAVSRPPSRTAGGCFSPTRAHDRWVRAASSMGSEKDGSEFPVEIGFNPIETDEGAMVLSAIVDITERKTADAALKRIPRPRLQAIACRIAPRVAPERNGTDGGHGDARIEPAAYRDQQLHGGDRRPARAWR